MTAEDIKQLQQKIPGGQFLEGSNAGNSANDAAERAQHAPAVESPLNSPEQSVANAVYRSACVSTLKHSHKGVAARIW